MSYKIYEVDLRDKTFTHIGNIVSLDDAMEIAGYLIKTRHVAIAVQELR